MANEFVLEMKDICKEYSGNAVLKNASLRVRPGEIHALLGENGAGKSTLMNILFGMPVIHTTGGFRGEVLVDGEPAGIFSPMDAMGKGIGMVHQEFMLIPGFTVTENIKLNRETAKPTLASRVLGKELESLDAAGMAADAKRALDSVGVSLSPDTKVSTLPVGYMQFVEIAREIDKKGIRLLVFDEPTAVLTESEADQLMGIMKRIAKEGIAIIFITHRLNEVMQTCDAVTVLRDGCFVAEKPIAQTSLSDMAALMIGNAEGGVVETDAREIAADTPVALSIRDLFVDMPGEKVKGLNLDVHEGEIIGIGGLAGQGKVGVSNGVMGLYPARGDVQLFGRPLKLNDARGALRAGLSMVSEDRKGVGLLLDEAIEDNIAFTAMQIHGDFLQGPGALKIKSQKKIRAYADKMIAALDIRCTSGTQPVGQLSGGNQQKVCVAKALALSPKFLFVSEPTRGIDIGAKALVLQKLKELNRKEGLTIVMVSSELGELRSVCDRIAIVAEGKVVDILAPGRSDADFGLAMSGIRPEDAGKEGGAA